MKNNLHCVLLLLAAQSAHAELINVSFTDTTDSYKSIVKLQGSYINPMSPLAITASGGLDRKFKITIYNTVTDELVKTVNSNYISINDRLTDGGNEFYGKVIDTETILLDGSYRMDIELLNLSNELVQLDSFSYQVDTQPPATTGNPIKYANVGWGGGDINHIGYLSNREFSLDGLSDTASGLATASFVTTLLSDSQVVNERQVELNAETGRARLNRVPNDRQLFPEVKSDYNIGFKITDKAGNELLVEQQTSYDGTCSYPTISHIWNPLTDSWEDYSTGMVINENPYTFRLKVKKEDHLVTSGDGFGHTFNIEHQDENYVYTNRRGVSPKSATYYTFYKKHGFCGVVHQPVGLSLGEDIDSAPKLKKIEYKSNGVWVSSSTIRRNIPYIITAVRMTAEIRIYDQLAKQNAFGQCTIPAGGTSCEITGHYEKNIGAGYAPHANYLSSANGDFPYQHTGYLYTYWDFDPVVIKDAYTTPTEAGFSTYDKNSVSDWRSSMWYPNVLKLEVKNLITNHITYLNPKKTVLDHQNYNLVFDLQSLANGNYEISGYVRDTYGNETRQVIDANYLRDSIAPTIKFTAKGQSIAGSLQGLENLRITLEDASESKITSVKLSGGPANDDLLLAWTRQGSNIYSLEYPRLYPGLTQDTSYSLKVIAIDIYGNEKTNTVNFTYMPENIVEIGRIRTLASPIPLFDKQDNPIGSVTSTVLRTDSGSTATGLQAMFVSVRPDSPFSINFAHSVIAPGETKEVYVDLGDSGKIDEVVTPIGTQTGSAVFLIDIPQLTSKYDIQ